MCSQTWQPRWPSIAWVPFRAACPHDTFSGDHLPCRETLHDPPGGGRAPGSTCEVRGYATSKFLPVAHTCAHLAGRVGGTSQRKGWKPSQTPHQTASIPARQERPSLSSPLKHKPRCLPQPCSSTQRPSRKDTGPNWDLLVEQVGPVQPGEHSHSKPREVSLQLPLLWQGSDRQACSAAKTRRP